MTEFRFPLSFALWGLFFRTVAGGIMFRFTTKVPFLGTGGAGAQTAKVVFFLANSIAGAIHHVAPMSGLPLELLNNIFLVSAAVVG